MAYATWIKLDSRRPVCTRTWTQGSGLGAGGQETRLGVALQRTQRDGCLVYVLTARRRTGQTRVG